jgi:serine/threonine-protein kinase RsbW
MNRKYNVNLKHMSIKKHQNILSVSFPSIPDARKEAIEAIIKKVHEYKIPIRINENEIYLVIDEALTNAMEHGNRWDRQKKVIINVVLCDSKLTISIEDEGPGFDIKTDNDNNTKSLALRGRGIKLIKQFCTPQWNLKGNRIDLFIEMKQ